MEKVEGRTVAGALLMGLILVAVVQIVFYPGLASWTHKAITGQGWDGSGLRYFQLFRILPAGLVLAIALTGIVAWMTHRNPALATRVALLAWAIELALFAFSVVWYAAVAGGRRPG